jgi:hypothetical protein
MLDKARLTGSQRQRGLYLNITSKDVGPDPDWKVNPDGSRTWVGYDKKKKDIYEQ